MKFLNENISKRANREDEVTGRFWEGRFKGVRLNSEGAILACMVYVDLNEVRAKLASSPEESQFCSVYERIVSRRARNELKVRPEDKRQQELSCLDSYLSPIEDTKERLGAIPSLSLDQYLEVVDATGRATAPGKAGVISNELEPILKRMSVSPNEWLDLSQNFTSKFSRVAGFADTLRTKAEQIGKRWIKGIPFAEKAFITSSA